jgi:putative membrane protein insertion efficiency factor
MFGFAVAMVTPYIEAAMKTILLALIRLYQLTLSALLGRRCRYLPTCSEYASTAISRHGAWRGCLLAIARVSRCHPWGGAGFDPVPDVYAGPVWRQKKEGPREGPLGTGL